MGCLTQPLIYIKMECIPLQLNYSSGSGSRSGCCSSSRSSSSIARERHSLRALKHRPRRLVMRYQWSHYDTPPGQWESQQRSKSLRFLTSWPKRARPKRTTPIYKVFFLLTLFNKYDSRRQQQPLTHKYDGVYLYYIIAYYKQSLSGFN